MASQYYGLRGSRVKEYQRYLNSLGAGLAVDGTWGPRTERAYNRFMDEFNEMLYGPQRQEEPEQAAPSPEEIRFTPRTEEALRAEAEAQYAPAYDAEMRRAEQETGRATRSRQALIDALTPMYEEQMAALAKEYARDRENLSNQALSRGLGRSSYLMDQLSGSQAGERQAQQNLLKQRNSRQAALEDEIESLLGDLDAQRSSLTAQREQDILRAIEKGRAEDLSAQNEATRYNNSLRQDARDYAQKVKQFDEELKLKKLKLK